MKAMVLAAGLGTRMRPLTGRLAKPALPVLNRPLIHWSLARLAAAGVTDVVVNLHHRPESVRRSVGDGSALGLRVSYSYERRILGTGGGPRRVRDFFGDGPCLIVNGDVVFDFDLLALVRRHREAGARATLALLRNPDPRSYTPVVVGPGGRIRSIGRRPSRAAGPAMLFTGVHVLDPRLLERLPAGASDSVRDLYVPMLEAGERVLGARVRGAWYDLGRPWLYLQSQVEMLASPVHGAGPRRSLIHSGARVAEGARISDSVVGDRAVVGEGAVVARSVLWGGARVGPGARVTDSVLDGSARVGRGVALLRRIVMGRRRFEMR